MQNRQSNGTFLIFNGETTEEYSSMSIGWKAWHLPYFSIQDWQPPKNPVALFDVHFSLHFSVYYCVHDTIAEFCGSDPRMCYN